MRLFICLLILSMPILAAPGDNVVVTPASPTTADSLQFRLFNMNNCCCSRYYDNTVSISDTIIILSYSVDVTPCTRCYCFAPGSYTTFESGPLKAGTYGIYKAEIPYCPDSVICPEPMIALVRVGEVTITGKAAGGDTLIVTPAVPTTLDSVKFDLFNYNTCCCAVYHNSRVSVTDTVVTLSFEVDLDPCAVCRCYGPGSWTSLTVGPLKAGTYAVYKQQDIYCAPGEPCPLGIAAPVRVGEFTVIEASLGRDTLIVSPAEPTTQDSLDFSLYVAAHCCCSQYHNKAVLVNNREIVLSYEADHTMCALCMCVMAGNWIYFDTGPVSEGTYDVYRLEDIYCPPGQFCIEIAPMKVKVGQVTVKKPISVEIAASVLGGALRVMPNPFHPATFIRLDSDRLGVHAGAPLQAAIYDVNGKVVFQHAGKHAFTWNAEGLPSGIYILNIYIGNKKYSKKLFLQK